MCKRTSPSLLCCQSLTPSQVRLGAAAPAKPAARLSSHSLLDLKIDENTTQVMVVVISHALAKLTSQKAEEVVAVKSHPLLDINEWGEEEKEMLLSSPMLPVDVR